MWVHLQILAICREQTPRDVRNALRQLPEGLDATYIRIIENISKTMGRGAVKAVHTVLKAILYAKQLVSPDLLIGALAVAPGENSPDSFKWTLNSILSICQNLVIYDSELDALRFAHFSIREFLMGPVYSNRHPGLQAEDGHTTIAEVCLTVLTYGSEIKRHLNPAIIRYSTLNWGYHVRLSGGGSQMLERLWKGFLTPPLKPSAAYKDWASDIAKIRSDDNSDKLKLEVLLPSDGVIPPVIVACYYRLFNIFKFLVDSGAMLDCRNKSGDTVLSHAAYMGYDDFVRVLVDREDVDLNSRNGEGKTPLVNAATSGSGIVVQMLLELEQVDLNSRDIYGQTPLSCATQSGSSLVVGILLANAGVDRNLGDDDGRTPLSWAAEFGYKKAFDLLLADEGVDPDSRDSNGRTPLSWGAEWGPEQVVEELLANEGVDPDSRDCNGRTPLSWAAARGQEKVVTILLSKEGVDPDPQDSNGRTPLSWAAESGYERAVDILLASEGVDPNSRDRDGRTPLSWAAARGRETVVDILLAKEGIDPDSRDCTGRTPLAWAAEGSHERAVAVLPAYEVEHPETQWKRASTGHPRVIEMLLAQAVDPEWCDDEGNTPYSRIPESEAFQSTRQLMLNKITENHTLGKNHPLSVESVVASPEN